MKNRIYYLAGYKYQLVAAETFLTPLIGYGNIASSFIVLENDGKLTAMAGYAWDGPSGPCPDLHCFMMSSLVHDVIYQLMREGLLPQSAKPIADRLFHDMSAEAAPLEIMADIVYEAVDHFGYSSCEKREREVLIAP
jgi:hypothetical protein